jgi:transposase-like protein
MAIISIPVFWHEPDGRRRRISESGYLFDATDPKRSVLLLWKRIIPGRCLSWRSGFPAKKHAIENLAALRWPGGWSCPRGVATEGWTVRRNRWFCGHCRYEMSVTAGTVFQDSHLPLTIWFRAIWQVTSQKNGISAMGLQRVLGLESYQEAWMMLHKLRRAMIRPGRDCLSGVVEVDQTCWGAEEPGLIGRLTENKVLVAVAIEEDGRRIGRIRLETTPDLKRATLHGFIAASAEPGSTVRTDGFAACLGMDGYVHQRQVKTEQQEAEHVLPRVHLVIGLLKRWMLGMHQGAIGDAYLDGYRNEFTFRFNRRTSASRGKLFYRLAQQAVQIEPVPFAKLVKPQPVGLVASIDSQILLYVLYLLC